jgi:phage shock protein C
VQPFGWLLRLTDKEPKQKGDKIMATGKKLLRSNDRWIAGVCGGIAEYFDWDPALVRLLYILLSVFSAGFPGTLIYIILWIVMPKN